jgi:hypothetical protein
VAYARSQDEREGSWSYDGESLTARITVPAQQASGTLNVTADFARGAADVDGLLYRMKRAAAAVAWLKDHWEPPVPLPDDVSLAGEVGTLINYHPDQLPSLVKQFDARLTKLAQALEKTDAKPEVKAQFIRMIAPLLKGRY